MAAASPPPDGGDDLNDLLHYSLSITFDPLSRSLRGLTAASAASAAAVAELRAELAELRERAAARDDDGCVGGARADVAALRDEVRALAGRLDGGGGGAANGPGAAGAAAAAADSVDDLAATQRQLEALRDEVSAELVALRREMKAHAAAEGVTSLVASDATPQLQPRLQAAAGDADALPALQARVANLTADVAALRAALASAVAVASSSSASPAPVPAGDAAAIGTLRAEIDALRQQAAVHPPTAAPAPSDDAAIDVAACLAAVERALSAMAPQPTAGSHGTSATAAPFRLAAPVDAPLLNRLAALADAARPLATAADVAAAASSANAAAATAAALAAAADVHAKRVAALETRLARLEQARTAAAVGEASMPSPQLTTQLSSPTAAPARTAAAAPAPAAPSPASATAGDLSLLRTDVAALAQRLDGVAKQQQQQQQPSQHDAATHAEPANAVAALQAALADVTRRLRALESRPASAPARRPRSEPAGRRAGSSDGAEGASGVPPGGSGAFTGRPLLPDPLHCLACGDALPGGVDALRGPWVPVPGARSSSAPRGSDSGRLPTTAPAAGTDAVSWESQAAASAEGFFGDTPDAAVVASTTTTGTRARRFAGRGSTPHSGSTGGEATPSQRRPSLAQRAAASPASQFLRVTPLQQQAQPQPQQHPAGVLLAHRPQTASAALPAVPTSSRRGSLPRSSAVYVYPHPGVHLAVAAAAPALGTGAGSGGGGSS
jgi:trimeric autotransporter adhesin